jgi:hypothetical protein
MPPDGKPHDLGQHHEAEPAQQPEFRYDVLEQGGQQAREKNVEPDEQRLLLLEIEQKTVLEGALADHAKSTAIVSKQSMIDVRRAALSFQPTFAN